MHNPKYIIEEIKSLIITGTDINSKIDNSNHLLDKQIDYTLISKYHRPIEFKILSTPNENLSLAEFLIYAGEKMNFDYVDILFGKFNQLDKKDFITRLTEIPNDQIRGIIDGVGIESSIFTIDETSSCQTFVIQAKENFYLILENWQI